MQPRRPRQGTATVPSRLPPSRRLRLAAAVVLALAASLGALPAPAQETETGAILVISRERVMQEAAPAKRLNDLEAEMTAELQARVDAVKARLSAEEQELTRLRDTLPREEFDRRVQLFDQTVRRERRLTQRRAAALQTAFREARSRLVDALIPILVAVSREKGARLVLDSGQILLAHPSLDVTNEVIALFNARVAMPELPSIDELAPPAPGESAPDEGVPGGGAASGAPEVGPAAGPEDGAKPGDEEAESESN